MAVPLMTTGKRVIHFRAKDLERGRRHMWRPEYVSLLMKCLEIAPGQEILDVGCGTGYFTRLLAYGLRGKGHVTGLDRNRRLLQAARGITADAGLAGVVSFKQPALDNAWRPE
ncbi:MAG: methyltransferase domain-containing protein [Nitrososphaerota archaeon]|nr:methyltransferase domain-containing protein [Nitrososphaerota archaeon]